MASVRDDDGGEHTTRLGAAGRQHRHPLNPATSWDRPPHRTHRRIGSTWAAAALRCDQWFDQPWGRHASHIERDAMLAALGAHFLLRESAWPGCSWSGDSSAFAAAITLLIEKIALLEDATDVPSCTTDPTELRLGQEHGPGGGLRLPDPTTAQHSWHH